MQSDSLLLAGIRKLIAAGKIPSNEDINAAMAMADNIKNSPPYIEKTAPSANE